MDLPQKSQIVAWLWFWLPRPLASTTTNTEASFQVFFTRLGNQDFSLLYFLNFLNLNIIVGCGHHEAARGARNTNEAKPTGKCFIEPASQAPITNGAVAQSSPLTFVEPSSYKRLEQYASEPVWQFNLFRRTSPSSVVDWKNKSNVFVQRMWFWENIHWVNVFVL